MVQSLKYLLSLHRKKHCQPLMWNTGSCWLHLNFSLHSGPFASTMGAKSQVRINEKAPPFSALKNYIYTHIQLFLPELPPRMVLS